MNTPVTRPPVAVFSRSRYNAVHDSKPGIRAQEAYLKQAKDFIQHGIKSKLLNREQLVTSMRALPRTLWSEPETIAQHLIDRGELSRFQADRLLRGHHRGMVLGP